MCENSLTPSPLLTQGSSFEAAEGARSLDRGEWNALVSEAKLRPDAAALAFERSCGADGALRLPDFFAALYTAQDHTHCALPVSCAVSLGAPC